MEALTCFLQPAVRDLAWVIGSPPLLDIAENLLTYEETLEEYAQQHALLTRLNTDPSPLHIHLATVKRQTLGSYFEALVAFWLVHRLNTQLYIRNLQVQEGSRTLGEMDMIAEMGQITTHIETAVKFYLGNDNQQGWQHWIGPAARDRLDNKMQRLLSRQLHLSETTAGKAALATTGVNPTRSRLFMKGYFFSPYLAFSRHNATYPAQAHPNHHHGWWSHAHSIDTVLSSMDNTTRFMILPRHRWLAAAFATHGTILHSADTLFVLLRAHFAANGPNTPLLLAALKQHETGWHEYQRGFIVANPWPGQH